MTPSPDHSQGGPQYGPPEDQVTEQLGRMTGDSRSERRAPTYVLTVSVPLNTSANPAAEGWDIDGAITELLRVLLPLLRVGTLGLLCGDATATLEAVDD